MVSLHRNRKITQRTLFSIVPNLHGTHRGHPISSCLDPFVVLQDSGASSGLSFEANSQCAFFHFISCPHFHVIWANDNEFGPAPLTMCAQKHRLPYCYEIIFTDILDNLNSQMNQNTPFKPKFKLRDTCSLSVSYFNVGEGIIMRPDLQGSSHMITALLELWPPNRKFW